MAPGLRKLVLSTHIAVSVGWIGGAAVYLVLAAIAMARADAELWRAAWIALELMGWYAIVPMAVVALATGLVVSLGTPWGLFRHWWVVTSFALTTLAAIILVRHMMDVSAFARLARDTSLADTAVLRAGFRSELLHAGIGLVILLAVEALNVYKPRGLTPIGARGERGARSRDVPSAEPDGRRAPEPVVFAPAATQAFWVRVVVGHVIALAVLVMVVHLVGGGIRH